MQGFKKVILWAPYFAHSPYTADRRQCSLFLLRLIANFSLHMNQREGKSREQAEKMQAILGENENLLHEKDTKL